MPELPDVVVYVERIRERLVGEPVVAARAASPFVMRTAEPPLTELSGQRVLDVHRIGKRIVLVLEQELFLVVHLMIAGRLHWVEPGRALPRSQTLLTIETGRGSLLLTEAGKKRRAAVHLVRGLSALEAFDRGGVEVGDATDSAIVAAMSRERHTLKRALTDPRILSGIGNAYSDEILHRARLSPLRRTDQLDDAEWSVLCAAIRAVLAEWTERLRDESQSGFPTHVTAFRDGMAVHGRYGQPCPSCGEKVQRIVHAEHETNYCPRCQTEGRLLADRALSRLLREDWPRSLEELEEHKRARVATAPTKVPEAIGPGAAGDTSHMPGARRRKRGR